jgi:RNA polymerase sigma-70 factor (ECF subfamily)
VTKTDTEHLLERAATGETAARDQLLVRHRGRLKAMVSAHLDARLAARIDPSDVVQDVLTEAAQRFPQYLADRPVAFYPWIRQMAWERLIDLHRRHLRSQARSVNREEPHGVSDESAARLSELFVSAEVNPGSQLVRKEVRRRVQEALARLDKEDRELLLMRHLEGLKVVEIAQVLGIGERAAKSRLRRAHERIHAELGEEG